MGEPAARHVIALPLVKSGTVDITEKEFLKIKHARFVVLDSYRMEQAFDLLAENYFEFEQEILRSSLDEMVFRGRVWRSYIEKHQTLSRRIMNTLSTGTLYFDQARVPYDDELNERLQLRKKSLSDDSFDYRVGREVRNSITHWHHDAYETSPFLESDRSHGDRGIRFGTDVRLRVKALSEDPSRRRNRKLIAELAQMGDHIDLVKVIRSYVEVLGSLHQFYRDCVERHFSTAQASFERALRRRQKSGYQAGVSAIALDATGEEIDSQFVSVELLDYVRSLRRKNTVHSGLAKRFVSSKLRGRPEPT